MRSCAVHLLRARKPLCRKSLTAFFRGARN
nr:MAG TPA: hypothetical protein [Caudoviricetes sp.]